MWLSAFRESALPKLEQLDRKAVQALRNGPEIVPLGIDLIIDERQRQLREKGWSVEHDDGHTDGGLAVLAATLAVDGTDAEVTDPHGRGTAGDCWGLLRKHGYRAGGDKLKRLAIAGALIAAEIMREMRLRSGRNIQAQNGQTRAEYNAQKI